MFDRKEIFNSLQRSEEFLNKLFLIQFVVSYKENKLSHIYNNTDLVLLNKIGITKCLKCFKEWSNTTIPNNSHNFSKEIMLGPYMFEKNKVLSINTIRSFQKKLPKGINKFSQNINKAGTFGGICKKCDLIYNDEFEKDKRLDFDNIVHQKLLIERASFFTYYKEKIVTEIIKILINLDRSKAKSEEEWKKYLEICKKIKNEKLIEKRNMIFNQNLIFTENIFFNIYSYESPNNKGVMSSDIIFYKIESSNEIIEVMFNVFSFNGKERIFLACKNEIKESIRSEIISDLYENISLKEKGLDLKLRNVIINPEYIFSNPMYSLKNYIRYVFNDTYFCLIFENNIFYINIDSLAKYLKINPYLFSNLNKKQYTKINKGYINVEIMNIKYEINIVVLLNSVEYFIFDEKNKKLSHKIKIKRSKLPPGLLCIFNIK